MQRHADGTPLNLAPVGHAGSRFDETGPESVDLSEHVAVTSPLSTAEVRDTGHRRTANVRSLEFAPVYFDVERPLGAIAPHDMPDSIPDTGTFNVLGMRDGTFVDSMTEVIAMGNSADQRSPDQYISTFAGSLFEECRTTIFDGGNKLRGPEDVHAYCMQIAVGENYSDVIIQPERRSQVEALHEAAVQAHHAGLNYQDICDCVLGAARDLDVKLLDAPICWRGRA